MIKLTRLIETDLNWSQLSKNRSLLRICKDYHIVEY